MPIQNMNHFIAYVRVSTNQQGINGLGINSQLEIVQRFVAGRNGTLMAEFREVESGKFTDNDRPELKKALEMCKKTKATLVVAKLDRLSRNAAFLISLQNSGVDFLCVDAPNVDRFTCGILALVAQRERELISERTKAALKIAKARGVRLGCPAPEKHVSLMNEGAKRARVEFASKIRPIIEEIKRTGISTLQGIADCLNRRGIQSRTGKIWHPSNVRNVLIG